MYKINFYCDMKYTWSNIPRITV